MSPGARARDDSIEITHAMVLLWSRALGIAYEPGARIPESIAYAAAMSTVSLDDIFADVDAHDGGGALAGGIELELPARPELGRYRPEHQVVLGQPKRGRRLGPFRMITVSVNVHRVEESGASDAEVAIRVSATMLVPDRTGRPS